MTEPITLDAISRIGQRRVNDTMLVELPELGGSVKLRQISGAEQDAAVALGQENPGQFTHIVAREQIKASMVEPALPADEADAILDALPVQAFGQLHAAVLATSGLYEMSVEELVSRFRDAAIAKRQDANRSAEYHARDEHESDRMGTANTEPNDRASSVLPSDGNHQEGRGEEGNDASETATTESEVTA